MVLLGKVNSDIVQRLNRQGQPAVGLSGEDGTLFEIRPVAEADKVGFVGEIERVDVDVLNHIASDFIPVIASAGTDRDGNSYNVNADSAAGKVAAALRAYKAIFLTDVEGWRADADDPGDADLARRRVDEVSEALPGLDGGMRPKLGRLRRGDRRRRPVGAHRRRPPPPQPPARALHRRRHRHEGHAVSERRGAEGARGALRDAHLPAGSGRVRARRGLAALGRRGPRVPRPVHRALGPQRRPLPPADRRRDRASRRRRSPAPPTSSTRSPRCGSPSGWSSRRSAAAPSSATPARRRTSARSSSSAATPTRRGIERPEIVVLDHAFHGRTLGGALGDAAARPRGPVRAAAGRASSRSRATTPRRCARRSASARRR